MKTLEIATDNIPILRFVLLGAMRDAEDMAALWFNDYDGRPGSHWMFRDALKQLRICHELRKQLMGPPSQPRRNRRS